jgi:hypothetical protein
MLARAQERGGRGEEDAGEEENYLDCFSIRPSHTPIHDLEYHPYSTYSRPLRTQPTHPRPRVRILRP